MNVRASNGSSGDIASCVEGLRRLPEVALEAAKKEWYAVGAAHLARTKANTPVGQYSNEVRFRTRKGEEVHFFIKKVPLGGQLRLRWQQTPVIVRGDVLRTSIYNNTEYAPYVEYGHRVFNKAREQVGYVSGRHMMTNSAVITDKADIPAALERIVEAVQKAYESR